MITITFNRSIWFNLNSNVAANSGTALYFAAVLDITEFVNIGVGFEQNADYLQISHLYRFLERSPAEKIAPNCYASGQKKSNHVQILVANSFIQRCYVSDLEEGEKTLLLHEGEGKLSRVRSRLIYRDFPGVRPCTGRDSTLARKRIGLVL